MCRMIEQAIEPAYQDEDDNGGLDIYDLEEEESEPEAIVEHISSQTPVRTQETLSFFPQDFINNSQMAILIIKRQLMLLIHANYCTKIDNIFPDRPVCEMQSCGVFKGVLEHLKVCQTLQCDTPRCISSRNILRHYSNCYNMHCHICF